MGKAKGDLKKADKREVVWLRRPKDVFTMQNIACNNYSLVSIHLPRAHTNCIYSSCIPSVLSVVEVRCQVVPKKTFRKCWLETEQGRKWGMQHGNLEDKEGMREDCGSPQQ
jgi:hypothetical protein